MISILWPNHFKENICWPGKTFLGLIALSVFFAVLGVNIIRKGLRTSMRIWLGCSYFLSQTRNRHGYKDGNVHEMETRIRMGLVRVAYCYVGPQEPFRPPHICIATWRICPVILLSIYRDLLMLSVWLKIGWDPSTATSCPFTRSKAELTKAVFRCRFSPGGRLSAASGMSFPKVLSWFFPHLNRVYELCGQSFFSHLEDK